MKTAPPRQFRRDRYDETARDRAGVRRSDTPRYRVIGHENNESQIAACLRWSVAIAALNSLTKEETNQTGFFLTDRGRLTPEMPKLISAAVEHCSKEEEKWQPKQARN
jgi:hypothetical protein